MLGTYYIVVLIALALCLLGEQLRTNRWIYLMGMGVLLILFAGLKGRGVSLDDNIYLNHFNKAYPLYYLFHHPVVFFSASKVEPTFLIISSLVKAVFPITMDFEVLIFLFALVAVSLKLKAINDYSEFAFFSVFVYICNFFLLHEIVQIRIGLAVGIAMLAFRYAIRRDPLRYTLVILLATVFHYSCILFLPFYFLNTKKINPILYLALIVVPFVLSQTGWDPISILSRYDLGVYSEKIRIYQIEQARTQAAINPMNMTLLFQLLLIAFMMFYRRELAEKTPYGIFFLKINVFAITMFYLFFPLPVFAFRLWEMLSVVDIFLIPCLLYFIKPRWVPELVCLLVSFGMFMNLVIQHILRPYSLVF